MLSKPVLTLAETTRILEAARAESPDHAYILDSLAWAHFRRGEIAEAWNFIRKAISQPDGGDPTIWEHYGDIAMAMSFPAEARKGYTKALELRGDNEERVRAKLNTILKRRGQAPQ